MSDTHSKTKFMGELPKAEQIVYDILSQNVGLMADLAQLHLRIKEISQYYDQVPAVGVKAFKLNYNNENGLEEVVGFCEVVAIGEYESASAKCEDIASQVYRILNGYGNNVLNEAFNGIETSGYEIMPIDQDGVYACLAHVAWKLIL